MTCDVIPSPESPAWDIDPAYAANTASIGDIVDWRNPKTGEVIGDLEVRKLKPRARKAMVRSLYGPVFLDSECKGRVSFEVAFADFQVMERRS